MWCSLRVWSVQCSNDLCVWTQNCISLLNVNSHRGLMHSEYFVFSTEVCYLEHALAEVFLCTWLFCSLTDQLYHFRGAHPRWVQMLWQVHYSSVSLVFYVCCISHSDHVVGQFPQITFQLPLDKQSKEGFFFSADCKREFINQTVDFPTLYV